VLIEERTRKKPYRKNQKGFTYAKRLSVGFDLTYLSRRLRDGIGTLLRFKNETGCQGFTGPLPSAFLDKRLFKRSAANIKTLF